MADGFGAECLVCEWVSPFGSNFCANCGQPLRPYDPQNLYRTWRGVSDRFWDREHSVKVPHLKVVK